MPTRIDVSDTGVAGYFGSGSATRCASMILVANDPSIGDKVELRGHAASDIDRLLIELDAPQVRPVLHLDISRPLPEAPWFEPGARWSARRVLFHGIAETAQHAGHADIIREPLDGAKSMG